MQAITKRNRSKTIFLCVNGIKWNGMEITIVHKIDVNKEGVIGKWRKYLHHALLGAKTKGNVDDKMGEWLQKYLTKIMQCLGSLYFSFVCECVCVCVSLYVSVYRFARVYQWHCFVYLSVQASLLCCFGMKNTKWKCFRLGSIDLLRWLAFAIDFVLSHTEANQ